MHSAFRRRYVTHPLHMDIPEFKLDKSHVPVAESSGSTLKNIVGATPSASTIMPPDTVRGSTKPVNLIGEQTLYHFDQSKYQTSLHALLEMIVHSQSLIQTTSLKPEAFDRSNIASVFKYLDKDMSSQTDHDEGAIEFSYIKIPTPFH
jgi:hypothetical protein